MRLAVYCDFPYRRHRDAIFADQAFVLFLIGLTDFVHRLVLVGRLEPNPGEWHYRVASSVEFADLPHYPKLNEPVRPLRAISASRRRFGLVLDDVDVVWLFGPHPLALVFALQALWRRKRVVLGIRQDYLGYVRSRHPNRRALYAAAVILNLAFRQLARACAVVTVGPELAHQYRRSSRLLAVNVVLVKGDDVIAPDAEPAGSGGDGWTVLSVGRLDAEKNPLLLADVLAHLIEEGGEKWRLTVCGEGPLSQPLQERCRDLGIDTKVSFRGYVPVGSALFSAYRESDCFLHTSLTEGVPQVLFEAFAAGLPVVATDVGAIAEVAPGAVLLIPPADADAAVAAIRRLATDEALRAQLVRVGLELVRAQTLEAQCRRVADFLAT